MSTAVVKSSDVTDDFSVSVIKNKISKKIVGFILGVFLLITAVILFSLCVFGVVNSYTTQIFIGTGLGMIILGFSLFIRAAILIFRYLVRAPKQIENELKNIENNNIILVEKLINQTYKHQGISDLEKKNQKIKRA